MPRAPAFQFYPAEFLSDERVVLMSNQELGCYIKLLCYCWREGSIPVEVGKIARLCGETEDVMAQLWRAISLCFAEAADDTLRLVHPRLEAERKKQEAFREERARAGTKGAHARWHAGSKGNGSASGSAKAKPINQRMANHGSSSLLLPSSTTASQEVAVYLPEFEAAWSAYPKRAGDNPKGRAFKAWKARLAEGYVSEDIIAGIKRYANYALARSIVGTEYVKQAATFLGPDKGFLESWVSSNEASKAEDCADDLMAGVV